ncbi:hypothetical protein SAMD00019534_118620 [Acytostelium subglobosum LB1]|uniref:hypothetical protein n=1 Tax=Acytostelium subglobosum LB1 TaxID=1410327 RepID=UPI000644F92B|nr:hypothetical protein SAMD00019534_118620 [Acytostelium subglobosum LB1]GAM28686.1 hypothetical protein SAMD00019534_118620 [Acytostelium subglobosum LB1]|eukprot:XP_012748464.1 hypothetical protein SAMD00019534_118620 [Acytostelium subglobosum LB1]
MLVLGEDRVEPERLGDERGVDEEDNGGLGLLLLLLLLFESDSNDVLHLNWKSDDWCVLLNADVGGRGDLVPLPKGDMDSLIGECARGDEG